MTELQEQLKKFAKEAEQLAKDMHERAAQTQLYDLEQSYRDNLERLSKQLEKQGAMAKQLGEQAARLRKDPANREQANAFRQSAMNLQKEQSPFDEPNQQQLAKTAQDVEKMQLANDLISQGERLRSVILQQRELADRMAQFRDRPSLGPDDLQRLQRLAKEQELLRQELDEAKSELEKTAKKAQQSPAQDVRRSTQDLQIDRRDARQPRSGSGRPLGSRRSGRGSPWSSRHGRHKT